MKTTKPGKQRKRLYSDPIHKRYKRFAAHLKPELSLSHKTNAIPVRTGDTVQVMRGEYRGFEGKISRIDRKNYRIFVEGVTREKVEGGTTLVSIHPSKVMITRLNLDDKWRKDALKRKGTAKEPDVSEEKVAKKKNPRSEKISDKK